MTITPITSAPSSSIRGLESMPAGSEIKHPRVPGLTLIKNGTSGRPWTEEESGAMLTTYGAHSAGFTASDFGADIAA